MNKPDPKIRATSRALRVAYVLEDGIDSHNWLDAIFADCFGRDGGRQSLIVPILDGQISDRFKFWLRLLDPDIVVLITYDNVSLVEELAALLSDTELIEQQRNRDKPEMHPKVSIERTSGLTSLSWLPFFKTVSGSLHTPPTHILDRFPSWDDDGIIKDNFGTLYGSLYPYPMHQQIGIRGLVLTPENPPENRWHLQSIEGDEVQDAYVFLENLGSRNDVATLGQLSNLGSQPHRPEHHWTEGFCLVLGDSFDDRVSCWNAGLLFADAQNQRYKTLRVPAALAVNAENTARVGAFLRNCNWLGSNNGPARVFVRSHSIVGADLEEFVARLGKASRSTVTFVAISSPDDCCPSDAARVWDSFNILKPGPTIIEAAILSPTVVLSPPKPIQLSYCAGLHPIFSQGSWFVDLFIDRLNDIGLYSNIRETWSLPSRGQLVRYFCKVEGARLRSSGVLSLPITTDTRTIEIKQPDDSVVFQSLLVERQQFAYRDLRGRKTKKAPYKYAELSDKGSYLQGLIGMFGSLSDIEQTMRTHFWRKQFENMAAPAQSQHEEVIKDMQLRMQARDGKLVIEDDAGWQKLAQRIIQKASRLKVPRMKTSYNKLLTAWTMELSAAIEKDDQLKQCREDVLGEREDDLKRSLSYLFERSVLYRGHEWSCKKCRHRNWLGVGAFKERMPCEVCSHEYQLPVDIALDFRLNEFFATCIREHDTVTVAWALGALREQAKHSFMYAPQTALYRDYPENQNSRIDRELDLICIMDGKFVIGEVKAGSELIAKPDIEDLAAAAKEVGADIAFLAAVKGDSASMESKVQILRALLPSSIEARWILSDWNEEPSSYL